VANTISGNQDTDIAPSDVSYSHRYIAFIDVLGFGALVSESGKDQAVARRTIQRVSDAILCAIEELEENLGSTSDLMYTQFSDSFVVSVDADHPSMRRLFSFTLAILDVIDSFLISRLLLRGGIARGQLIHTSKLLFGPAMNRAHELESKVAKVPRIVLDPMLDELEGLLPMLQLARDIDDLHYIDYFAPRKAFYLIPSWLQTIRQTIEEVPVVPALEEKRTWLVTKFNMAISDFSYEGFKGRLDEYVDNGDANPAVVEDYAELLTYAREVRRL
jgi:hypothetical protein